MKLSDKFTLEQGRVYLTGIQALVRLPIDQMRRDRRAGLNTGAFISGYEGSPLGGYDMALARAGKLLSEHNIHFRPGVNEDLAATAVFGSQIIDTVGKSKVEGVVGIWYGKGPGVDRSGDIFRHANLAGSAKNGGALLLCGDDPISKSSTIPSQSDFSLYNLGIPYLYPGNVQEILDYGLLAIALSRFSAAWVGMKMVTDVCDGGGTAELDPSRPVIRMPEGYQRHTDPRIVAPVTLGLEHEVNVRQAGGRAPVRAAERHQSAQRSRGAHRRAQHRQILFRSDAGAARSGGARRACASVRLACRFRSIRSLCGSSRAGWKRYSWSRKSGVSSKCSCARFCTIFQRGRRFWANRIFRRPGELDPDRIATALCDILHQAPRTLAAAPQPSGSSKALGARPSAFCSGCPHNRSTLLLEGQIAGGGIGCHTMAMRLNDPARSFVFLTHMGGEGAPWIGMTPFVDQKHIFQNIGDGTLFHSGYLAIEACVAAKVNITYKILFNGHVAMTGGQNAVGALPIPDLTRKLQAEGVRKTVVLAEDVEKYTNAGELASNAELRPREELTRTLRELEQIPGVTVMIYDQECAAEKRRKRSRGIYAEPTKRLVIQRRSLRRLRRLREAGQLHEPDAGDDRAGAEDPHPSILVQQGL